GLEIDKPRTDSWRESDASASALAARYYVYVQDFANAKKYAEKALSLHNTMIDLNTIDLINYLGQNMTADIFTASYSPEYYTCWESSYKMYHNKSQSIMVANDELLAAYQPEDLRLQYFYTDKLLGLIFGVTEGNTHYWKTNTLITGTDVAEMYLILAECAARNNDIGTCMENVEMVRINRIAADDYITLPIPGTAKEAVQLVANERWREFPFKSLRWYDIKRLNADGLIDPIILSRDYYEVGETAIDFDTPKVYTLEPGSRKYARPIPKEVVILTGGSVKQNTY
ncbi:MAG: RagB/SusD family nutrient uptake outer membrane protein, partial [Bacteroidales bacterium]|nr:RagB/SusD family nutrient uptake outer membrane protein [Bacteroidales bacterium]